MHVVGDRVWVQHKAMYGFVMFVYPSVHDLIVVRIGADPFALSLSQVAR